MNLFLFFFACIGLTLIITNSYLFKPIRNKVNDLSPFFGKLLKFTQCTGFWVGLIIRSLDMWKYNLFLNINYNDLYNIVYGFASSFICYASYLLLKFFIEKYD